MAGLSPEQVQTLGASSNANINKMLEVFFKNKELGLKGREASVNERVQSLNELKFTEEFKKNKIVQENIANLKGYTAENIYQAPADVILSVTPTSMDNLLAIGGKVLDGKLKPKEAKTLSQDERIIAAAIAENKDDPYNTDVFKMAMMLSGGKGKEQKTENVYKTALEAASKSQTWGINKEKDKATVEEFVGYLTQGQQTKAAAPVSGVPTKAPGAAKLKTLGTEATGNPLLDEVTKEFMARKQKK